MAEKLKPISPRHSISVPQGQTANGSVK
jgi:hypothetical protein